MLIYVKLIPLSTFQITYRLVLSHFWKWCYYTWLKPVTISCVWYMELHHKRHIYTQRITLFIWRMCCDIGHSVDEQLWMSLFKLHMQQNKSSFNYTVVCCVHNIMIIFFDSAMLLSMQSYFLWHKNNLIWGKKWKFVFLAKEKIITLLWNLLKNYDKKDFSFFKMFLFMTLTW